MQWIVVFIKYAWKQWGTFFCSPWRHHHRWDKDKSNALEATYENQDSVFLMTGAQDVLR